MSKPVTNHETTYITVKDFAEKVGITTQALYKKIRNNKSFADNYTTVINSKTMIHISALVLYDTAASNPDPDSEEDKENQTDKIILILQEQLKAKDEQIEKLTQALTNAQTLQMAAERRYLTLIEQKDTDNRNMSKIENTDGTEAYSDHDPAAVEEKNSESISIWKRIKAFFEWNK